MPDIVRLWDGGSRNQRIAILTNFVKKHQGSTASELDRDLGHAGMLLFTRITAWLRLTYQLGYELSIQLAAFSLFILGQKYLTNFMEVGGIQTLTDILATPSKFQSDRNNGLLLLIHIANSGRVYREMICDGAGADMIVRAVLNETNDKTLELASSLFLSLGQGNPRKASVVHGGLLFLIIHGNDASALCAATTLRSLQILREQHLRKGGLDESNVPIVGAEGPQRDGANALLDAFFHLLKKDNVKLRFEGTELISIAAKNQALTCPVLSRCFDVLEDDQLTISAGTDVASIVYVQRQQTACGRSVCNILLRPHSEDALHRIVTLTERRGAHTSLVKYLLLSESKDVGAVGDCCKALQVCARGTAATRGAKIVTATEKYMRQALSKDVFEEFMHTDAISDELAGKILRSVKEVEEARRAAMQGAADSNATSGLNNIEPSITAESLQEAGAGAGSPDTPDAE